MFCFSMRNRKDTVTPSTKSDKIKAEQPEHQTERWGDCFEKVNPIYESFHETCRLEGSWNDQALCLRCRSHVGTGTSEEAAQSGGICSDGTVYRNIFT